MFNQIIEEDVKSIINGVGKEFKRLEDKKLLITGPNGLLASYIVDTIAYLNDMLFDEPCKVIGIARSKIEENDRLGHLLNRKDINFIYQNIKYPIKLENVNFIIHAAGRSSPQIFVNEPISTIDTNITALRWLLSIPLDNPIESFIFFSSSEIYGNPTVIPTPETYIGATNPLAPRGCYTESKRCCEALCSAYFKEHKIPVKIIRPAIVYGPGLSIYDKRVIGKFIKDALIDGVITLLDRGDAKRSYCYITDAMIIFWKVFFSDFNGEAFNVGNQHDEITIKELAQKILKITGGDLKFNIKEDEFRKDAPNRVRLDMSKVKERFGFEPEIKIDNGLKRIITWNKEIFNL